MVKLLCRLHINHLKAYLEIDCINVLLNTLGKQFALSQSKKKDFQMIFHVINFDLKKCANVSISKYVHPNGTRLYSKLNL